MNLTPEQFQVAKMIIHTKLMDDYYYASMVGWTYLRYLTMKKKMETRMYVCLKDSTHEVSIWGRGSFLIDNITGEVTINDCDDEIAHCLGCKSDKHLLFQGMIDQLEDLIKESK